jgi:glutamate transport system ATP-binding protein
MYGLLQVEKHYGEIVVLRDITCDIPTEGLVAIMGPSGSGKSTLLRLLSFIELPDRGIVQLALNGDNFDSASEVRPWPRVTCVFQKQFLWPHLTLLQNILLPLEASDSKDSAERVRKVVDLFDMADFISRFPNEVSGGQAQRAALARAFVLNPELILIDEAHSGLDLEQQAILNGHLLALRSSGVRLLIVTHSFEFARLYADQVVVLEDGSITEVISGKLIMQPRTPYLQRATRLAVPSFQQST